MKNIGYTLAENQFCSGFVPLMELWKLKNSQLCLLASKVNAVSPKPMLVEKEDDAPTESAQDIEEFAAY